MVDDCLKMNLPEPEYKYTFAFVQVIFKKTQQKSTKEQIITLMKENQTITISDISKTLGIGRDTINEHIAKLKKEKRLKRIGGSKSGNWEVI